MATSKPLRILMVEDDEEDAQLILRALRNGGYEPEHLRVETAEALKEGLAKGKWDVILADYRLPSFSGPEALKVVKERGLDVPFLIVSGTVGEDTAVASMKAGAHDFFVKGNLARLCAAIEREMREAGVREAGRRADEFLRESEEKYRTLVENIPDLVWRMSRHGKLVFVSNNAVRITGFSPPEIYEKDLSFWFERVDPEDVPAVRQAFDGLFKGPSVHLDVQYRFLKKDGRWVWLWSQAVRRFQRDGVFYVDGLTSDITRLKLAEQRIKEYDATDRRRLGRTIP